MSECLGVNSIYCSSIQDYMLVQLFKEYIVVFVGEIMKCCSVLLMFSFSLERFRVATTRTNRLLDRLSKTRLRNLILVFIFVSTLLSYNKINEYNESASLSYLYENPIIYIYEMIFILKSIFFTLIYLFHYILFDFVILLINLIVDIWLVIHVKRGLKQKKAFNHKLLNDSVGRNKQAEKRLDEIRKSEKSANQMIIFSLVVYIFCRLPELVVYLYFSLPVYNRESINIVGPILINIIQFLYVFSYSLNLLFYFKFNFPFKIAFSNIFTYFKEEKK